jgi:hypothetical protein
MPTNKEELVKSADLMIDKAADFLATAKEERDTADHQHAVARHLEKASESLKASGIAIKKDLKAAL